MTLWIMLTVTLAGINLVRATGRGITVAVVSMLALAVTATTGWIPVYDGWRFAVAVAILGVIVVTWQRMVLPGRLPRASRGLLIFAVGFASQIVLLENGAGGSVGPWIWAAAFLVLAEPSTRFLRQALGLMGKPPATVPEAYGRGEAIGVLERWITLVMIARGDYAAMAFVIAAKALARHKRFEQDPEFAEYFLVGTLASLLLAIAAAEIVRGLGAGPMG